MKKNLLFLALPFLSVGAWAQEYVGLQADKIVPGSSNVWYNGTTERPTFITMDPIGKSAIRSSDAATLKSLLNLKPQEDLKEYRNETDQYNWVHHRYSQYVNGIKVEGGEYLTHLKNGQLESLNGNLYDVNATVTTPTLTKEQALTNVLNYVGAVKYMWEDQEQLQMIHEADPTISYTPTSELVYYPTNGEYKKGADFHLAYKIDVYASEPLSRAYYFVDAATGAIIGRHERIHTADAKATASTRYSGSREIMTTQSGSSYVLQETGRLPAGIKTYNCKTTKSYSNTNFSNASTTWNLSSTGARDNAALDAHWATEMMFDFLKAEFNRNSIDNAGMAMLSYVHYDVAYLNAFWDGNRMTYGDGNATSNNNPLTSMDVGGHEVTHGVTERSAQLVYQGESGALNESFSDIFGKTLEHWARPTQFTWQLGTDLGWVLRDMQNPGAVSQAQPKYYKGKNWYTGSGDNGGVHYNSGVQNYWYYLLVEGGSGTNEKGQQFNIKGIGFDEAIQIVYRSLTNYMSANNQYTDSRNNSIKAAKDLFGDCSPQLIAVTDAWAAVGVGAKTTCTNVNVNDVVADNALSIYPNPSTGFISIEKSAGNSNSLTVEISNMVGEKLYSTRIESEQGMFARTIDLSSLPAGVYFATLRDENAVVTRKIVLK